MRVKAFASHLVENMYISTTFEASILVEMIWTVFSILSLECRGLRIERKDMIELLHIQSFYKANVHSKQISTVDTQVVSQCLIFIVFAY